MIDSKRIYKRIVAIGTSAVAKKGVKLAQDVIKRYDNPKTSQKLAPNLIFKKQKSGAYVLTYRKITIRKRLQFRSQRQKSDVWNPTVFLEYGSPRYKTFNPPKGFYQKAKETALKDNQVLGSANNKIIKLLDREILKAVTKIKIR